MQEPSLYVRENKGAITKKFIKSILPWVLAMCLCACSPASKEEATRYVKNEFGKAEYARTEEIDDETIRYYFVDEEEYFMADVLMNVGGSIAWYTNYEEE